MQEFREPTAVAISAAKAKSARSEWIRRAVVASILGLLVLPVWIVKFPPLVDYPNHLTRYFILAHLKDPYFAQFYASNWGPYPYVALDALAWALQFVLPIDVVGRIILSAALLGLPLGAHFFLRQVDPGSRYLATWTVAMAYSPVFLTGFLNDMLSEGLCFFFLGLSLKYLRHPTAARWLGISVVATVLYFTHLVGFAMAGIVIAAYAVFTRQAVQRSLSSLFAFLPGAVVYFATALQGTGPGPAIHTNYYISLASKFIQLGDPFRGYSRSDMLVALIAILASIAVATWRNPEFRIRRVWFGIATLVLLAYFGAPDSHFLRVRILPFFVVLALAASKMGRRASLVGALGLLVFAFRSADIQATFFSNQPELERVARSFAAIPIGSRVIPLVEHTPDGHLFRHPYLHMWAYGVRERKWFSPFLFHTQGIHCLRFRRAAAEPKPWWPKNGSEEPDWQRIRQDYEYVWVYNLPRFTAPLLSFSQLVYSDGRVMVFSVSRNDSVTPVAKAER